MFINHVTGRAHSGRILAAMAVAAAVILLAALSVTVVPAGHVGVITRFGAVNRLVYPGLNWKIPIAEGYVAMDVRTRKDQIDATAASKDLQIVTSTIAVNYRLDGQYATDIYQNVGTDYQDILIAPAIQNVFKGVTAQFTAEELITKREQVRIAAEDALAEQLSVYHILIDNFNIVNFDFSPEFNAAIEAKQVAQQDVEKQKQLLAKAEITADTLRTEAQGIADAQKILQDSGALTPEYLTYLALTKWDGKVPLVVGGDGGIPLIQLP
jgi:regulator of protease activity HflC (stomatin/prohibitin superfamily)